MPGNVLVETDLTLRGARASRAPRHHEIAASHERTQLLSAATLLQHKQILTYSPERREHSGKNVSDWEDISLIVHRLRTASFAYRIIKRLMDIAIVLWLLPILLPLLLVVAAIVRISSKGPVLFRQRRVGQFGREFSLWKFRSMYTNGDDILSEHLRAHPEAAMEWATCYKLNIDPRVTRVGRLLRRASLDELPQFFNVLMGSMSLVGPRPIVSIEKAEYRDSYFYYVSARPGMSGLWQVSGRSDLTYHQRVTLDETYVRGWSLGIDIGILFRTAGVVWRAKGAT